MRSSIIFFASPEDQKMGNTLGFYGEFFDFRMEQIKRRMDRREEKFQQVFPLYFHYINFLCKFKKSKRLIFGNIWPSDLDLLQNLPEDVCLTLIPHKLDSLIIMQIVNQLKKLGRDPVIIDDDTAHFSPGITFLIIKKGILCELYKDFGKAYVGGGFGESVHSLLEPLIAGCEHIACGPVHFRSTEFDQANSFGDMKEVKNNQEFLIWLQRDITESQVHAKVERQLISYSGHRKELISC